MTDDRYIEAVQAIYPELPPAVKAYLDTFRVESRANREAREVAWNQIIDEADRRRLIDIMREIDPQLFS